jgi:RNA:NAD 2'-phosphotransferase (TPT1/KptA family)
MSPAATIRLSKRLSWLLRHGAGKAGLDMDAVA